MKRAIGNKLSSGTSLMILAMVMSKAVTMVPDTAEKEILITGIQATLGSVLTWSEEFQPFEEILESWPTTVPFEPVHSCLLLAEMKRKQGKYSESETLHSTALTRHRDAGKSYLVPTIVGGYAWTLLEQGRFSDAAKVYLDGLALYNEALGEKCSSEEWALEMQCVQAHVGNLRSVFPNSTALDQVIERLETMSIDS